MWHGAVRFLYLYIFLYNSLAFNLFSSVSLPMKSIKVIENPMHIKLDTLRIIENPITIKVNEFETCVIVIENKEEWV